jgi:DNA ligase-1
MRRFAALFEALDTTTATRQKLAALGEYFAATPTADAAWAVHFLGGERLRRLVGPASLRRWLVEASRLPEWLIEETYAAVGDLAETIALLMELEPSLGSGSSVAPADLSLHEWIETRLLPLASLPEPEQHDRIVGWWRSLPARECYLLNKLLTGALRVGVAKGLLARALAQHAGLSREVVLGRLAGDWSPSAAAFEKLIDPHEDAAADVSSRPYPFMLASALEGESGQLGDSREWLAEWKWDGMRAQLIRRAGRLSIWSRGEELVTERFPEIAGAAEQRELDAVLDGEILVWGDAGVRPFGELQTRIGRKRPGRKLLAERPVAFLAYDLLEHEGRDLRPLPLAERRRRLETLLAARDGTLMLSPAIAADDWPALAAAREQSRKRGVEGLMLKRLDAPYASGRTRGAWWKWKVAPFTLDGVLLYAHPGHGRRASLYTDYTFGVWQDDTLVPVAKAYSGLDDREIRELDAWIRRNTVERFGPVRSVRPEQVFELAFEGINRSTRHRAGVALRFPRILRWRTDKRAVEADRLATLQALLESERG